MMHYYRINEFLVESDAPIPVNFSTGTDDTASHEERILLRRASLAHLPSLLRKVRRQLVYDVGDGFLLEPHPDVALHIDLKGETLTLDCPDERVPVGVAWAVHAGLGAATLTHGGLPLHGAGLEVEGKALCLMADSGTGKSTLSWYLLQQGFRFRNDDLIPIRCLPEEGAKEARCFPSVSLYPKLSREAVDRHGLAPATLPIADYGTGEEEYYIPLTPAQRSVEPRRLSAIFLLHPANTGSNEALPDTEVIVNPLSPESAATILMTNLHAVWLIGKWMDTRRLYQKCVNLASLVPMFELRYNRSYAILPVLERVIRETLSNC